MPRLMRPPDMPVPAAFVVAAGDAALFVATVVAIALHLPTNEALVMMLFITAAGSLRASVPAALSLGVVAWLFLLGFVVNDLGELRVHGSADWLRLGVLLVCASLVARGTRPAQAATV